LKKLATKDCKNEVLVACEYSGTVRDAFAALGHDAGVVISATEAKETISR